MPECLKCKESFPNWIVIKDKKRNLCKRKYCLSCSPFGAGNRKSLIKLSLPPDLSQCILCKREYYYNRSKGHMKNKCNSCITNGCKFNIKQKMLEYKGKVCQKCGYDKCPRSLCFHHVDPKTKSFTLATGRTRSWDKIYKELDKCILLCLNCHGEEHFTP